MAETLFDYLGTYDGSYNGEFFTQKDPIIVSTEDFAVVASGHSSTLSVLNICTSLTGNVSIEGWFVVPENYYHSSNNLEIFSFSDDSFIVKVDKQTGILSLDYGASNESSICEVTTGDTHYITFTLDDSSGVCKVYLNAVEKINVTTATRVTSTAQFIVGNTVGLVDNIGVYNSVLTIDQIETHYGVGSGSNKHTTLQIQFNWIYPNIIASGSSAFLEDIRFSKLNSVAVSSLATNEWVRDIRFDKLNAVAVVSYTE